MDIRAMPSSHPKEIAAIIALHRATMILDGVLRPCEKLALERFLSVWHDVTKPFLCDARDQ